MRADLALMSEWDRRYLEEVLKPVLESMRGGRFAHPEILARAEEEDTRDRSGVRPQTRRTLR